MEHLSDYSVTHWVVLLLCGMLVGISKTGVPGIGIVNIPLMAIFFPARLSTGMLLPMLAIADVFAVSYYRRHAKWKHVLRLLPWALLGIGIGCFILQFLDDKHLQPLIGIIVLVMLLLNIYRQTHPTLSQHIPTHWAFAAIMGFAAGVTTQLANAAGPVMVIYLLAMQLPKDEFIGTGAWYFMILNWLKIPLFIWEGRITLTSVKADLVAIPCIAIGAVLGILILKKVPQKWFNIIIQALAIAAALKLTATVFKLF